MHELRGMNSNEVQDIVDYLRTLAPVFFVERMRGASEQEINRLEQIAGTLADSHKEFLRHFGATPATALNPLMNDRDFAVATLVRDYTEPPMGKLPPGVVMFSSSDILGEVIYLRNGQTPGDEPEIGDLSFEEDRTEMWMGRFVPRTQSLFHSWLRWNAFEFRASQPEYSLSFRARWNVEKSVWESDASAILQTFVEIGLLPLFDLLDGFRCFDRGDVVSSLQTDGSGRLVGDDLSELERIRDRLLERTFLEFHLNSPSERMFAPRD